jgi:hypothetical protein
MGPYPGEGEEKHAGICKILQIDFAIWNIFQ